MSTHNRIADEGIKFQVVPSTRKIIIPTSYNVLGAVGDHNSEQITFQCPKTIDGHDVVNCSDHYVIWKNAKGETGRSEISVITTDDNNLYLGWTISSDITAAEGYVDFSLHFEDIVANGWTAYKWSTAVCTECLVLESITYSGESDTPVIPDGYVRPSGTLDVTTNGEHDVFGYAAANVAVPVPTLHPITISKNGTYEPDDGYGYSKAIVNVQPELQEKTVDENGEVTADIGYYGLSKVTVAVPMPEGVKSITVNGEYDIGEFEKVTVNVGDESAQLHIKTVEITENGTVVVQPDEGYDGMSATTIVTNVQSDLNLQEKTVTENGEVTPDAGYAGLSKVIVDVSASDTDDEFAPLTSYNYTSDTSITYNDKTLTFAVNEDGTLISVTDNDGNTTTFDVNDNGLITKATDMDGKEISPRVGEQSANTGIHNAIFMTMVALLKIGDISSNMMPHLDGVNWYYDANEITDPTTWTNLRGESPLTLVGATCADGVVTLEAGGSGYVDTGLSGDITIYMVCKNNAKSGWNVLGGMANTQSQGNGYELIAESAAHSVSVTTGAWGTSPLTGTIEPQSAVWSDEYNLIVIRRSGETVTAFFNGVAGKLTKACYGYSSRFVLGGYYRGSNVSLNTVSSDYKCIAIASGAHSDSEITTNSQWLMNKYGI